MLFRTDLSDEAAFNCPCDGIEEAMESEEDHSEMAEPDVVSSSVLEGDVDEAEKEGAPSNGKKQKGDTE